MKIIVDEMLMVVPPEKPVSEYLAWLDLGFLDYEANEAVLAWLLLKPALRTKTQALWAWLIVA